MFISDLQVESILSIKGFGERTTVGCKCGAHEAGDELYHLVKDDTLREYSRACKCPGCEIKLHDDYPFDYCQDCKEMRKLTEPEKQPDEQEGGIAERSRKGGEGSSTDRR